MNTSFNKLRKSLSLLAIGSLLSTLVVVSPVSAANLPAQYASWGEEAEMAADAYLDADKQPMADRTANRFEAAKVLATALELEEAMPTPYPFTDVPEWAKGFVGALSAEGVVTGKTAGSFCGGDATCAVNRGELAVMLDRAGLLDAEPATLTAAQEAEFASAGWAKTAMQKAVAQGVIKGFADGTLRPGAGASVLEVALLAYRATDGAGAMPTPGDDEEDDEEDDYTSPLEGTAGSIDNIETTTSGTDDDVKENQEDAVVFAFDVEAEGSDLALTSFRLEFANVTEDGSTKFDRYVEEVSVWQGDREVGRTDADSFSENDGGDDDFAGTNDVYSRSISLEDAVVREDDTVRFYVAVSSRSVIDSADFDATWNVALTQVRYEDATGTVISDGFTGLTADFSFEDLSASGDLELKITKGSENPKAQGVEISENSDTKVLLNEFTLRADGSELVIDKIPVTVTVTGAADGVDAVAKEFTLEMDGDELDTVSTADANGTTTVYTFDDLDDELVLAEGEAVTLQVYAEIRETLSGDELTDPEVDLVATDVLTNGDTIIASLTGANRDAIDVEDENGDQLDEDDLTGTSVGEVQTLYTDGIVVTYVSSKVDKTTVNGSPDTGTYKFEFEVSAFGEAAYIDRTVGEILVGGTPLATQVSFSSDRVLDANDGTPSGSLTSSATIVNGMYEVEEGDSERFTLQIGVTPTVTGFYEIKLEGIGFNNNAGAQGTELYTSDLNTDFRLSEQLVFRGA